MVMIVDDPEKGIAPNNIICHKGDGTPCKHLIGDEPGEYSCAIHDKSWYKDTPCFAHRQIEQSPDEVCRLGKHMMELKDKCAKVNEYGDLVCPNCTANILTPPNLKLKSGIGKCSRCSQEYRVTQEVADLANKLSEI
jgi:DNA-directed RNA polymerase subunit RPC12/RpoP